MYRKIPTILTSDEILEKAMRKASKASGKGKDSASKARSLSRAKISSITDLINSTLLKYVRAFPSIDTIDPFYNELIDVIIGTDRLKKSLGAINWARKQVHKLSKDNGRKLKTWEVQELTGRTESYTQNEIKKYNRGEITQAQLLKPKKGFIQKN